MKEEYIDLMDEKCNVIGKINRQKAMENKLLQKGAIVLVFNSKREMLIVQRAKTKDNFPGYYTFGAGGCALSGETYEECAKRELEEELGIKNVEIKFLFDNEYKSNEIKLIQEIYYCIYEGDLILQKEEVERIFFMSVDKVEEFMKKEKFCPDLYSIFQKYLEIKK